LPAQLEQTNKQIDVAERGMIEQEKTGDKQRALLDIQKETEQFKMENILPKELKGLEEDILTKYVIRVGKDKEVANLGLDSVVKNQNLAQEDIYTPKYME
jgi:hypothetical protein